MHTPARVLLAGLALIAAGCSTTSGNAPEETRSGFDGARVVSISPHGAACRSMLCPAIGAEWNSKRPDVAVLRVAVFGAYSPISAAALQIDGDVVKLDPLATLTDFSRGGGMQESARSFAVPLATVRRLAGAQRAWVRVTTSDGALEAAIVDGGTDSKALHALRRFLAQVGG